MKHIKRYNETFSDSKYCHNCGEKLEYNSAFCSECGENQYDEESKEYNIKGRLEKTGSPMSKTPSYVVRSMNKTIDGTPVISGKINTWELSKWEGKEVTIFGNTKDEQPPKFNNPIYINSIVE